MKASEMPVLEVKKLSHPSGRGTNKTFAVGGVSGLLMQVTPNDRKTWPLRTTVGTKQREFGLGGYPEVGLAIAKERARELKEKIRDSIDLTEERKAKRWELIAAQRRGLTLEDVVARCLGTKRDQSKNHKRRQQWQNTLQTYTIPELGNMLVQDISAVDVLRVLQPIWIEKTETAKRLRGRTEDVLTKATVSGHGTGDNPAVWFGNLKELLLAPKRIAKEKHQPALQFDDAQRWLTAVRQTDGM